MPFPTLRNPLWRYFKRICSPSQPKIKHFHREGGQFLGFRPMLRYASFGRFFRALGALLGSFGGSLGGLLAASWGLLAPLGGLWGPSWPPLELHNPARVAPSAQEASKEAPKPIPEPPDTPSKDSPKESLGFWMSRFLPLLFRSVQTLNSGVSEQAFQGKTKY